MEKYPLWLDNREVGSVTVQTKGLYYHFMCACNIPTDIDFRVSVHCGENITDLGICVPDSGSFILRKQVPIKYIGQGQLRFYIGYKKQFCENVMLLCADKHFEKIASLESAKLMVRAGTHYIYWD